MEYSVLLLPLPQTFVGLFLIVFLRYLFIAGGLYWFCYHFKKTEWISKRIDERFPPKKIIRKEFNYSVVSSAIFALAGTFLLYAWDKGWTLIYIDPAQYGWTYFFFSMILMAFIHEFYFYWTHRIMHHPFLFKHVHIVHHYSTNPTPFAAFSFHPIEAIIEAAILPALVFVMPIHPTAFVIFLTMMTVFSVINHSGYELYPPSFAKNWFFKWWISATHHQMHHQKMNCNYGLYFTVLDHIHHTHDDSYLKLFEKIKLKSKKVSSKTALATIIILGLFLPSTTFAEEDILKELNTKLAQTKDLAEQSRLQFYIGQYVEDDSKKEAAFKKGVELANQSNKAKENAPALFWLSANQGGIANLINPFSALSMIGDIEKNLLKIKKLDPGYQWNGADRILAHLYAELPPIISIGDNQKAEDLFNQLIKAHPEFPGNQIYYANFLSKKKKTCDQARDIAYQYVGDEAEKKFDKYSYQKKEWKEMIRNILRKTKKGCR